MIKAIIVISRPKNYKFATNSVIQVKGDHSAQNIIKLFIIMN